MIKFINWLADWIYKKKCYFCSKSHENTKMCSKCFEKIEYLPFCAKKIILNTNIYCACEYSGIIKKLIRGVKYHNQIELAQFQAKIMLEYWQNLNKNGDYIVVPVPLSKERLKKRKYNQTELVAEEFCKLSGYTLNTTLIQRIKNTKPQYKLSRNERMKNLENAFKVTIENYNNAPILLLDDVCTTGATFESILSELNKNGINKVTCFATAAP